MSLSSVYFVYTSIAVGLLTQIIAADLNNKFGKGIDIEIRRRRSIKLNGIEIDENSLVSHLEPHERELIFGKTSEPLTLKLVHLSQRTSADVGNSGANVGAGTGSNTGPEDGNSWRRRSRRAAEHQHGTKDGEGKQFASVQIKDNEELVKLQLQQTPKLIDDAFVFIKRNANGVQFIENALKLVEQYGRCFYRSENSALDLCDNTSVRGVFQHNASDFVIQPLPKRFGDTAHVIYEATRARADVDGGDEDDFGFASVSEAMKNVQFEPDEDHFTHSSNAPALTGIDSAGEATQPTSNADNGSNILVDIDDLDISGSGNRKSQQQPNWNLRYKPRYRQNSDHHLSKESAKHHPHHHEKPQQKRHHHKNKQSHPDHENRRWRQRRQIANDQRWPIPSELYIETAIFVDSDLYRHMEKNFPKDTESHIIRFVLAMINGVQLLYHHPTLGRRINFVLKRLEVFKKDPTDLRRSSDIDTYLSNFCLWQRPLNPPSNEDPLHYDHAVILTGLDLYVIDKNGKVISQVVGLAPVSGMCTPTSSCTINEGKHFESVFVVAHEIGHNLGMRHDTKETSCDPSLHIMSPTLGSGKITWSKCSRTYLNDFLKSSQANCLFNRGYLKTQFDHSAEGRLPGERFDADQQCMLKYGRTSLRAPSQTKSEICHDLHCQRDRYKWTSHPALEGTACGESMWCRSGICVVRPPHSESTINVIKPQTSVSKANYEKSNFVETSKRGQLLHEYNYNKVGSEHLSATWSDWGEASPCDSSCLYGPSKRLREGSTGLRVYNRSCLNYRHRCLGHDRKFESCIAKQCYNLTMQTIEDFATQVCKKAQNLDSELTGEGRQIVGNAEESCKVFCKTNSNSTKSRRWTFPDGTTCRTKEHSHDDIAYCIAGRCEKFSCNNTTKNYYKVDAAFCQQRTPPNAVQMESKHYESYHTNNPTSKRFSERNGSSYGYNNYYNTNNNAVNGIYGPTTVRNRYENEVAARNDHGQERRDAHYKHKSESYQNWHKYNYQLNDQPVKPPSAASLFTSPPSSEWTVRSGCHSSCMARSKGVQVVTSRLTGTNNIQLCTHHVKPCENLLTAAEYAENTCERYKLKVRGLSGHGTQIAASIDEPDRSCRVGCQDEYIKYRYYLVNGKYGHFPLGTRCSNTEERYCINGKCLEFGNDNIPLQQSHISLALFRNRRETAQASALQRRRTKRSFLFYEPINITETITQDFLNNIVDSIMDFEKKQLNDEPITDEHIEFNNPIHISMDEVSKN